MLKLGAFVIRSMVWLVLAGLVLGGILLGCSKPPGQREFESGIRELADGRFARAKVLFEKSITKRPADPQNAVAHNYLGIASARLGQLDQAIEHFEESRRMQPGRFEATYNLGVLMDEGGYIDEAFAFLDAAAFESGEDTTPLEYQAAIHTRNGRYQEAAKVLIDARDRDPTRPSVLTSLALVELTLNGPEPCEAYLMQALEHDADYGPALFNLGLLYEKRYDRAAKALALFEHYLEVEPTGEQAVYAEAACARLMMDSAVATAPDNAATGEDILGELSAPKSSSPSFDKLLGSADEAMEAGRGPLALERAMEAAKLAEKQGDMKRAEEAFKTATRLGKEMPGSHLALAEFFSRRGLYEEARESYKRSILLDPRQPKALTGLAEAAVETGEMDAALVALKRAVRMAPNEPEPHWALAFLYDEQLGLREQAAKCYRDFTRLFPDDPRIIKADKRIKELTGKKEEDVKPVAAARSRDERGEAEPQDEPATVAQQAFVHGTIYQQRADWEKAGYYYEQAIRHDPNFTKAYYNLGIVYRAAGELQQAVKAYQDTLRREPGMNDARYNLALVYIELKQKDKAISELLDLLNRDGNYAPGHYALGLLYAGTPATQRRARRHYEKFLELAPEDAAAASVRAWLDQPRG